MMIWLHTLPEGQSRPTIWLKQNMMKKEVREISKMAAKEAWLPAIMDMDLNTECVARQIERVSEY